MSSIGRLKSRRNRTQALEAQGAGGEIGDYTAFRRYAMDAGRVPRWKARTAIFRRGTCGARKYSTCWNIIVTYLA